MNINNHINLIKLTGFFDDFSTSELLDLFKTNSWNIKTYEKGTFIHFESEKCTSWDIILSGEIIIQKIDEKGNILTLTEFGTGNNIGGNTLFSKYPIFPMSVFAKSRVIVLHITKDFVLKLCQSNQIFLIRFLESNSDKAIVLSDKIKSISMKTIRESIIDFINYEHYTQKNHTIKLATTKKELAERLGVQRTSLSRELQKMKVDGLIDYDIRSITIRDSRIIRKL